VFLLVPAYPGCPRPKDVKRLCACVCDLDGECKFIKTKHYSEEILRNIKKYVLGCHLGWMNRRRFCLQKGGS